MEVKHGYLLISDISGYTEFLVQSEVAARQGDPRHLAPDRRQVDPAANQGAEHTRRRRLGIRSSRRFSPAPVASRSDRINLL